MPVERMALLIPLLSITLGIGVILTLILTSHRAKLRELDQRHRERMAAIDKGLEVPPVDSQPGRASGAGAAQGAAANPDQQSAAKPASRYLLRGLIWLGIGLAIALPRSNPWDHSGGVMGWIAVAVGVAYLIYYAVEGNRAAGAARPPDPPAAP